MRAIIKLYISSIINREHKPMLIIKNDFLFNLQANKKHSGTTKYINNKADNPKNITLLKHTNPLILPKFNISVL